MEIFLKILITFSAIIVVIGFADVMIQLRKSDKL